MPRVVVTDPLCPLDVVASILGPAGVEVERAEHPAAGRDVVGVLIPHDGPTGAAEFDLVPELRIVATTSIGYDHIDLAAAGERGIWACHVPDYCVQEVADTTIALHLALLRGIVELDRNVRAGAWNHEAAGPLRRLVGTRLGIVGFGRIGRAVAERARGLGLEVWACDPYVAADEFAAAGVRPAAFAELLESCRAVSVHSPLTAETETLIGAEELARMPDGAVLVNTSRGRLVDVEAVLAALASGRLAGAALDVLPVEPPTAAAPAPEAAGLIVTPHAAWYSVEAERESWERAALAIRAVLAGERPPHALAGPPEPA